MTGPETTTTEAAGTTASAAPESPRPARRGWVLPGVALLAALVSLPLAFVFALVAWPLMLVALVCAIIGIRRRDRMWGLGVAAIIVVVFGLIGMFVGPLLLTLLAFAAGARSDDAGLWWEMFWGLCWYSWLGPLAG